MEQAVLAIDIGTTSLKAALITEGGAPLVQSRRGLPLRDAHYAAREWLPALRSALADMLRGDAAGCAACAARARPAALCVSGNGPTVVTASGETLLWNEPGAEGGGPSLFIPRLATFKSRFPKSWKESENVFGGPEYFLWRLTDAACTILPAASFVPAYWDDAALSAAGFSRDDVAKLPPFAPPAHCLGALSRDAAAFLGAEDAGVCAGLPVFCGAPDFVSALVGTGTVEPGVLCDRAGSSEGLNFCTRERIAGDGIRTLPSVIDGLWNASVLNTSDGHPNESGAEFEAFKLNYERATGAPVSYDDLVARLAASDGRDATLEQGRRVLMRIARNLKAAIVRLEDEARARSIAFPSELRVCGGQAKCALWNQMKADVTDMTVVTPAVPDAELVGDAAFAYLGLGAFPNVQAAARALCKAGGVFRPNEWPVPH